MFIVLLKFSDNRSQAPEFMIEHKEWIEQGFSNDVLLCVGSLEPKQGGVLIAHNISRDGLEIYVSADPFVAKNIVTFEVIEITPNKVNDRLSFLLS